MRSSGFITALTATATLMAMLVGFNYYMKPKKERIAQIQTFEQEKQTTLDSLDTLKDQDSKFLSKIKEISSKSL